MTVDGFDGLAAYFTHAANALGQGARNVVSLTVQDAYDKALDLSSGAITEPMLRRMDHPYARRHGKPLRNPDVINVQTGEFRAGWVRVTIPSADPEGRVENTSWVGPYLEQLDGGPNSTMFPRRPNEAVVAEVMPRFEARAERELIRAFQGK